MQQKLDLEKSIAEIFSRVYTEHVDAEAPQLSDDTVLLKTGLDSLGFAILIVELEEGLGYDPFTLSDVSFYPETFKQFVDFYDEHRPE